MSRQPHCQFRATGSGPKKRERGEGATDSRRQPLSGGDRPADYICGKYFKSCSTASRSLVERARTVLHIQGAPRNRKGSSAFGYIISIRREGGVAKRAPLMARMRPHRPVQQIHGLGPFFQHNPRGAFCAPAAKIRVHRRPPRTKEYSVTIGGRALVGVNETSQFRVCQRATIAPVPLYVFAKSIQYSGNPRSWRAIA